MRIGKKSRAKSPKTEISKSSSVVMCRNGFVDNYMKINRIPLLRSCVVELLSVESPSCIWVRLRNHITSNLVITDMKNLKKVQDDINENDYYMAPIEQGMFARCRLLKKSNDLNMGVLVMFIDHGVKKWIGRNTLAVMPIAELPYHPWQAICISIHGLRMQGNPALEGNLRAKWNSEHAIILKELMSSFTLFKTRTMFSTYYCNDYSEPNKVELFGLKGEDDTMGVSIAHLFSCRLGNLFVIPINVYDSSMIEPIENCDHEDPSSAFIPEFQKVWPEGKQERHQEGSADVWAGWSVDIAQVPLLTPDYLYANGYASERTMEFLVSVEGEYTESPFEWYARPMKRTNTHELSYEDEERVLTKETVELMLYADENLKTKADVLDSFYSQSCNRFSLNKKEICEWLSTGKKVYAILETFEDRAPYTGEWQRVQVMHCDDSCQVRYLDSGGRELVIPGQLYKIHPSHCVYPPLCGQFCLHGYRDKNPEYDPSKNQWSDESVKVWNRLLRVDIPISIMRIGMLNKETKKNPMRFQEDHRSNFVRREDLVVLSMMLVSLLFGLNDIYEKYQIQ
ncbi:unnamed protein product [Auanema sp. JU1783]|nr:unnamed protein product [Auanema sp. JU1783]